MSALPDLAVISVTTVNYLHRARALMQGVARHLPEARRVVYCVDSPVDNRDVGTEDFALVDAATLALPRFRQLAFALNATGLCCALKPHAALHALATGARRVIYLDNDIQLFRRPTEMLAALERHHFILTPHLLGPLPPGAQPDATVVLAFGVFNAGMFATTDDADSRAFLEWWGARTFDPASMRPESGYDQIWLNFAPAFLAPAGILRDEGYNVAAWNLASRPLTLTGEGFRVGPVPLTTFHFSWFDEADPSRLVSPKAQCNYRSGSPEAALLKAYADTLVACGSAQYRNRPYGFSTFSDGRPISPEQRRIFAAEFWNAIPTDADPFDPTFTTPRFRGRDSLYRYHEFWVRAARALRRALHH